MTWVKLDDKFWANPKVLRIGNEAAGAFARMLSHCGDQMTDGLIPAETAAFIARPKVIEKLTESGFLVAEGDNLKIPDYLEFNPSREQIEAKREADRKRRNPQ